MEEIIGDILPTETNVIKELYITMSFVIIEEIIIWSTISFW